MYDHEGNRVWQHKGPGDTIWPSKYYSVDPFNTKTKDIYAGNILLASVETVGATATPHYVHQDQILGSNIVTDSSGNQEELFDYYPYGDIRVKTTSGGLFDEQKKFGDITKIQTLSLVILEHDGMTIPEGTLSLRIRVF